MASPHHLAAEKLRRAVVARNTEVFSKFRPVNGEYVTWTKGQTIWGRELSCGNEEIG